MDLKDICSKYVAFLRALYLLHQNHHWITTGYDNHLLFERIYKTAQENADLAAEKFIGLFGSETLALEEHPKLIAERLATYSKQSPVESSLAAEKDFLEFSEGAYYAFQNSKDKMTLGLDDMIMSIASQREENVYLLQQSHVSKKLSTLATKFEKIV